MNRQTFSLRTLLTFSTCLAMTALGQCQDRPNVILLVADPLASGEISKAISKGNYPELESFVGKSVQMERFYGAHNQVATKAEILTGSWPLRLCPPESTIQISDEELASERPASDVVSRASPRMLPQLMYDVGYLRTGVFGDWTLAPTELLHAPMTRPLDRISGALSSGPFRLVSHRSSSDEKQTPAGPLSQLTRIQAERAAAGCRAVASEASRFISESAASSSPYFALIELRDAAGEYEHVSGRSELASGNPLIAAIEQILKAVESTGEKDSTFIWILGTRGHAVTAGMDGEAGQLIEPAVRVDSFVRWPAKLIHARQMPSSAGAVDVVPTLLHVAGIYGCAEAFDGFSLLTRFQDGSDWSRSYFQYVVDPSRRRECISVSYDATKVIVTGSHLLDPDAHRDFNVRLYDLSLDPNETVDRSDEMINDTVKMIGIATEFRSQYGMLRTTEPFGKL